MMQINDSVYVIPAKSEGIVKKIFRKSFNGGPLVVTQVLVLIEGAEVWYSGADIRNGVIHHGM